MFSLYGFGSDYLFTDRADAGRALARALLGYKNRDCVVLAIPRGGVGVAVEVADAIHAPLDLVIPRKIGAPGNPELAIGAVAAGGQVALNESIIAELGVSDTYLREEVERQLLEIDRRKRLYLGDTAPESLEGKIAIVVDDGLATGFTALAASRFVRSENPAELVLAVPVAPPETCHRLASEVDEIVCLHTVETFFAVGQFYADFAQVSDSEVIETLKMYREKRSE